MINKPLDEITSIDIEALVTNSTSESITLEYKRELPGTTDADKKEFLADVSALANTSGGDLLFGIQESDGYADSIVDIGAMDVDAEILRLNSLIASGLDPRIRYSTKSIDCENRKVLLIRIEKSWNGPHRVILKGHDKFYGRTSAGKYSLDVQELRRAFTDNMAVIEKLRAFRSDRTIEIIANRTPIPMNIGSKMVLHVLPFESFVSAANHDLSVVCQEPNLFRPLHSGGWAQRLTLEGALAFSSTGQESHSYLHIYRNGIIEAVEGSVLNHTLQNGRKNLPSVGYERILIESIPRYLNLLEKIGVQPPLAIGLTLTNMKGAMLGRDNYFFSQEYPILQDHLILPEAIINNFTDSYLEIIRPTLDLVWNACGIERSANFNSAGEWAPPRG